MLGAAVAWLGFRALGATGAKVAPYLVAALACDLTLAFLSEDLSQMSWVTVLAVSALSARGGAQPVPHQAALGDDRASGAGVTREPAIARESPRGLERVILEHPCLGEESRRWP